jgi:hypothetical protein
MAEALTPVTLQLAGTRDAFKLLVDVVDMFLDGIEDAKKGTVEDMSIGSLDDLLNLCGGYDEMQRQLTDLKNQIRGQQDG